MWLRNEKKEVRLSALVVTMASMPPITIEDDFSAASNSSNHGWRSHVLNKFIEQFRIEEPYIAAYEPLLATGYDPKENLSDIVKPFVQTIIKGQNGAFSLVVELYVFFVSHGLYEARARVMIRNVVQLLELSREEYFSLESALAELLRECEENLARKESTDDSSSSTSDRMKKYMKIGAVGLGAGAIIAVTGGLAAPAVAAALMVIGGTAAGAAAGFATFTVLASVFGTAGAGLAGYKMVRCLYFLCFYLTIKLSVGSQNKRNRRIRLRATREKGIYICFFILKRFI